MKLLLSTTLTLIVFSSAQFAQGTYTNAIGGYRMQYDAVRYHCIVGWNELFFQLANTDKRDIEGYLLKYPHDKAFYQVYNFPSNGTPADSVFSFAVYRARALCESDGDYGSTDCPEVATSSRFTSHQGLAVMEFYLVYRHFGRGDSSRTVIGPYFCVDVSRNGIAKGLLIGLRAGEVASEAEDKTLHAIVESVSIFEK